MKKVNLRELYPDVYKTDHFVEVTEDVLETIRDSERAEAAYDRRMYRYKAHYSLDCDNGIENAILLKPQTPEMFLEEKQLREQIYAAVMALPEKQAKRIYARYYLGMRGPAKDLGGTLRHTIRTMLRSYDSRASGDLLCSHRQGAWQI